METTIVYWGLIWIMEKKMEAPLVYRGFISEDCFYLPGPFLYCTLHWGYMVPNSGYLGPNRG